MLFHVLARIWGRHALTVLFLWGIPYWRVFLPLFSVSLEFFSVFWDVPQFKTGLLAQSLCHPNLIVAIHLFFLRICSAKVRRQL
ncbi:MAG: hypothetical protein HDR30_00480 [Lachnospiraceae bacterium]|nr:hypothetical protein [Lachnospiraceae bacterium]